MPKRKAVREEQLYSNMATKQVYHYVDSEKKIDQVSREIFKKKDVEIHYPIGFGGGPKYKNAKRFVFEGFKRVLPVGVQKSALKGLGFTKVLKPIIDHLEKHFSVSEIKIVKKGTDSLQKHQLCLTETSLIRQYTVLKNTLDRHKSENQRLATEQLNSLFPKVVKKAKNTYIKNSIAAALASWEQSLSEFSDKDKEAVRDLFDKLSMSQGFQSTETLLKAKTKIDKQYIEKVIHNFKKLMARNSNTQKLEKDWQGFLKTHSWLFSYLFSVPIMLLQDEAYVGGKNISNRNGKVTDFIVKNDLTHNVAFIEIKTHMTELIRGNNPYRGNDVYAMSPDVSGAITQVLNQRDQFQKSFANHRVNSDQTFETFNSKCVVLMGSLKSLDKARKSSFELFRNNSKDVDMVTFDELLARFEKLQHLMQGGN